jgi:putative copper resistance protein D
MTTTWFVLARAVHFSACLLLFGIFAFDRFVAVAAVAKSAAAARAWEGYVRWFSLLTVPVILASGAAWFALVAITMSGQALSTDLARLVWTQTQFGTVCHWRLLFWLLAAIGAGGLAFCRPGTARRKICLWLELFFAGLLLGSLAWAGHGQEGPGAGWHLLADVTHLLAAGLWPTGLLPFALLLLKLRRAPEATRVLALTALVRRFSALSLGTVALLAATGFVNGWFLVGSWANLFEQPYGRWLLVKISLFLGAVALGAVNLLRLKPRLLVEKSSAPGAEAAAARLQFNVWLELALATLIIVVVAILGLLPPAIGLG